MWTDEDRDLLLALEAEEREECDGCGHPMDVSTDRATSHQWEVHRHTCQACVVLEAEVGNDVEAGGRRGIKYAVIRAGG